MIADLVLLVALVLGVVWRRVHLRRRRRENAAMVVTTWPDIELHQIYGGWNADAYDAGTGHDRTRPFVEGESLLQAAMWSARMPRRR